MSDLEKMKTRVLEPMTPRTAPSGRVVTLCFRDEGRHDALSDNDFAIVEWQDGGACRVKYSDGPPREFVIEARKIASARVVTTREVTVDEVRAEYLKEKGIPLCVDEYQVRRASRPPVNPTSELGVMLDRLHETNADTRRLIREQNEATVASLRALAQWVEDNLDDLPLVVTVGRAWCYPNDGYRLAALVKCMGSFDKAVSAAELTLTKRFGTDRRHVELQATIDRSKVCKKTVTKRLVEQEVTTWECPGSLLEMAEKLGLTSDEKGAPSVE